MVKHSLACRAKHTAGRPNPLVQGAPVQAPRRRLAYGALSGKCSRGDSGGGVGQSPPVQGSLRHERVFGLEGSTQGGMTVKK